MISTTPIIWLIVVKYSKVSIGKPKFSLHRSMDSRARRSQRAVHRLHVGVAKAKRRLKSGHSRRIVIVIDIRWF